MANERFYQATFTECTIFKCIKYPPPLMIAASFKVCVMVVMNLSISKQTLGSSDMNYVIVQAYWQTMENAGFDTGTQMKKQLCIVWLSNMVFLCREQDVLQQVQQINNWTFPGRCNPDPMSVVINSQVQKKSKRGSMSSNMFVKNPRLSISQNSLGKSKCSKVRVIRFHPFRELRAGVVCS